MRGFVITLLSVSLIVIIVALTMSLRNAQLSTERALTAPLPLIYAAFLMDDLAYEFNSVVGPGIGFHESNTSMNITVADILHTYNHSSDISAYGVFLVGEVADRTASNITANFSNMSRGLMGVFIDEDYVYTNDHNISEMIFTRNGGTGATSYDLNMTVYAVRQNVTHMEFNSSGTLNVTIRYTDLTGTVIEQGSVFPGQSNTFLVDYPNGASLAVTVGVVGGEAGSLRLKGDGIGTDFAWTVALPRLDAAKRRGYAYNATIDYVQGPVAKHARLGK